MEAQCETFCKVVEEATQLLRGENGQIGNFHILGRFVNLKPQGDALVIGDLHGDLESLIDILKESNFLQRMDRKHDALMIFLGDYGDRGDYSAEVFYTILRMKLQYPKQVVLMRGNHEQFILMRENGQVPEDLTPSPHDLPMQFQARFGQNWEEAYARIRELFEYLYNALVVEKRYLLIHGGLPQQARTIEDLAYAHTPRSKRGMLEDMLWSDPDETIQDVSLSPRGAGKLFGRRVSSEVLKRYDVNVLIRGHEPCEEGFKINHDGRVLTLFSTKRPPYFNVHGAYLDVRLVEKFENAAQLIPYIHKF